MDEFHIRKAASEDALAIANVKYSCWQDAYRGIISDAYLDTMSIAAIESKWEKILSPENTWSRTNVLINQNNEVVGYVCYGRNHNEKFNAEAEILSLYLLKNYRHHGLGKRLFVHGIEALKSEGIQSYYLFVLAQNPAFEFYRKFKPTGEYIEKASIGGKDYDEVGLVWR